MSLHQKLHMILTSQHIATKMSSDVLLRVVLGNAETLRSAIEDVKDLPNVRDREQAWFDIFNHVRECYPDFTNSHNGSGLNMVKQAIEFGLDIPKIQQNHEDELNQLAMSSTREVTKWMANHAQLLQENKKLQEMLESSRDRIASLSNDILEMSLSEDTHKEEVKTPSKESVDSPPFPWDSLNDDIHTQYECEGIIYVFRNHPKLRNHVEFVGIEDSNPLSSNSTWFVITFKNFEDLVGRNKTYNRYNSI